MKILNITVLLFVVTILVMALLFSGKKDNIEIKSNDTTIVSTNIIKVEIVDNIIYIDSSLTKGDVLNYITSKDGSTQSYTITTSEGTTKSLNQLFEYDRLYVISEDGQNETYYTFMYFK